jgi:hypothetical protein
MSLGCHIRTPECDSFKFWTGATMDSERAWTACVLTLSVLMFFGAMIVGLVGPM